MNERVYAIVIGLPFTALFGWLLITGLRTGTMQFPQGSFTLSARREDRPLLFWLTAIIVGILTIVMAIGSVLAIFLPDSL